MGFKTVKFTHAILYVTALPQYLCVHSYDISTNTRNYKIAVLKIGPLNLIYDTLLFTQNALDVGLKMHKGAMYPIFVWFTNRDKKRQFHQMKNG